MAKDASIATGFAIPLPAMSAAEPCTGSYIALRRLVLGSSSPSDADGNMPSEPVSIAATSDRMSAQKLSVTITSQCIGQHVLELHVLVVAIVHLTDHLVPQHAGLHHVALFHRGDFVAPLARQLESDARDALDLVGVVNLRVDGTL